MEPDAEKKQENEAWIYWRNLIEELITGARDALYHLAPCELDGDSDKGVTELGFKLVLLGVLKDHTDELDIESERVVDGGRIDLFLTHKKLGTSLVIELKYGRVGFLSTTQLNPRTRHETKQRVWKAECDKLDLLTDDEFLKVRLMCYFNHASKTASLKKICDGAKEQCSRYVSSLRKGGVRVSIPKETDLYSVVIAGVGKRAMGYSYGLDTSGLQ